MEENIHIARTTIPDAWAKQGKCIWCGDTGLQVQHPVGMPDQIFCNRCQFGYEVDRRSEFLHVCSLPETMPGDYLNSWQPVVKIIEEAKSRSVIPQKQRIEVSAEEMIYQGREAVADSESGSPMQQFKRAESSRRVKLTEAEVASQVHELYVLGNTYQQIRKILYQKYRFSEEALQQAIEPLRQKYELQKALAWKKGIILLVVLLIFLVALGIIFHWLFPIFGAIIQQQLTLFGFSS